MPLWKLKKLGKQLFFLNKYKGYIKKKHMKLGYCSNS